MEPIGVYTLCALCVHCGFALKPLKYEREQFAIGGAERERIQVGGAVPAHGLAFLRDGDGAGARAALHEHQADRHGGILVDDGRDDAGRLDLEQELFAAFAGQRLFRRLPRLDLAARKLPEPGLRLPFGPLRHQNAVAVTDNGADDIDYRFVFHLLLL